MATTKKTAVKKTTSAKTTTAKKTATAKSVTKKTATSKTTVAKKTAAEKPAAVKKTETVTELKVSGNKKIGTLQKEFNKKFPYLRLGIFYSYARKQVAKGEGITQIDGEKTLASVRRADSGGDISISGNKLIRTLENEFDTVFGLYCQVCYTEADGHRYYTSGSADSKTLSAFNAECEKNGCKKGVYR